MRKIFSLSLVLLVFGSNYVFGQEPMHAKMIPATLRKANYSQFTQPIITKTAEVMEANKGFEQDPELGVVYKDAPKGGYYELLGKRTERTKTFAKLGSNGNEIVIRSSNLPMHYLDANGKWRTIRSELQSDATPGVFATNNLPSNVQINTLEKCSSIADGSTASITYNRDLELVYIKPDGSEQSLGKANWSNYTAGDDGISIKDAWPGIDMEMTLRANGLETNFTINHAMAAYADGKLVLRDHMQLSNGLSLSTSMQKDYNGDIGILNAKGDALFSISPAIAYERFDQKTKYPINYSIGEHNVLDINVPGNLLNKPEAYYPLIIDPIVATNTLGTAAVNFSPEPAYCTATNNLAIPAATTITDVQYTYEYAGNWPAATNLDNGEWEVSVGTCYAPGAPYTGYGCTGSTLFYTCGPATMTSIYSLVSACVPSISCAAYTLPVVISCNQYQGTTGGACSAHYYYSYDPFVVDVYGTTTADPVAISGSPLVCVGGTTTLSDGTSTGWSWSSSNPGIASVNAATGVVTGVAAGTATITYGTVPCEKTITVTVNAATPITGTLTVCIGTTTNLTDVTTGGTWSTTAGTGSVSVGTSGIVTGLTGGTATVKYTYPGGCIATVIVTVNTALPNITGTVFTMCQGSSISLTDATAGGTWSSTNTLVGTVSTTGVVTGTGPGTTTISYASSGGCFATTTVTVYAMPGAILGTPAIVCNGSSIILSDAVTGGNWSTVAGSGSVSVAGGTVTGLTTPTTTTAGTATVSYSFGGGACAVSTVVTINPVSPISPTAPEVCSGLLTSVSDAISGTWSSSNMGVATIGSNTGIISGLTAGTSTIVITYATGCTASVVLTVNQSPVAITGTTTLCFGNSTTFTDGTPGGSWSSSNTSNATIGSSSGIATAVNAAGGVTTIIYTMPVTGCNASATLTVNPSPAPIQGILTVCTGLTTSLSDPTAGGEWLSNDLAGAPIGSASGIVTGILSGTAIITYTLPTGCSATAIVTINSSPAAIEGNFSMCVGFPTQLSDPSAGGTWTSTSMLIATVDPVSGLVSPLAAGTTIISYTFSTGCNSATTVTVNPVPVAISGALNSCAGYFTPLSDASGGGTWSSSNTIVATINSSTGLVYAEVTGTSTIEYAFTTTGCYTTAVFTVNPSPVAIDGTPDICQGLTATFNDPTPGGIWTSSNTNASVGSTSGVVTGDNPGPATIIYTLPTTCFVSYPVTITPQPTPISGLPTVCHNFAITLSDGTTPGTWSVTAGSGTATISSSGVLTGGNAGVVTVSYTTLACNPVTHTVLVNPLPDPITGVGNLCQGSGTSLTDATPGGTWTSSSSTATVSSTGVVSGVDTGSGTYISYTLPTGCYVVAPVVVFPIPAPIQGVYTVCPGSSVVLSDITPDGAWSSSNGTIATSIAFTGRIEGEVAGTVTISYALISGCYVTVPFTVENPLPASLTVTQSLDSPSCAGQVDTFTATAVNGGTPTFEWENWGSYIGTMNPMPFVPSHGDYITCVMTTHNICSSPAVVQTSVVLNIYPVVAPQVVITTSAASDTASFLGEVYTFYTDVTSGGVNPGYQWQTDGVSVPGATNSTFTTHIYENNETISCIVTGTSPCDTPANTNIGVDSIHIYGLNYLSASSLSAGGNDLNLFPNPNTGNFTLSGTLNSTSGKVVTLEVTDMVGRTVYTGQATPQNGTIHADIKLDNDIAADTYLLRVYTESGTQTFHFVIGK